MTIDLDDSRAMPPGPGEPPAILASGSVPSMALGWCCLPLGGRNSDACSTAGEAKGPTGQGSTEGHTVLPHPRGALHRLDQGTRPGEGPMNARLEQRGREGKRIDSRRETCLGCDRGAAGLGHHNAKHPLWGWEVVRDFLERRVSGHPGLVVLLHPIQVAEVGTALQALAWGQGAGRGDALYRERAKTAR